MLQSPVGSSPALRLVADAVEVIAGHPEWQARGTFVTDEDSSFLYLRRLTIEPVDDSAPASALTAEIVHDLRIGGLHRLAAALLDARADVAPEEAPAMGARPGRRVDTWPDDRLAVLANDYVNAGRLGYARYGHLGRLWPDQTANSLRTAVKLARRRGLLTATLPGSAGGALTDRGRALLLADGRRRRDPS